MVPGTEPCSEFTENRTEVETEKRTEERGERIPHSGREWKKLRMENQEQGIVRTEWITENGEQEQGK